MDQQKDWAEGVAIVITAFADVMNSNMKSGKNLWQKNVWWWWCFIRFIC